LFSGLLLTWALTIGAGCNPEWTEPARYEDGLVVVLPGVEGVSALNLRLCTGLDDGGVKWAIELTDWSGLLGPLGNQTLEGWNRLVAEELSKRIVKYREDYPGRPVVVIGHSGGTAMAVWITEAMPEDHYVDGVILLSSSLSAQYDLLPALEKSLRGIINFYSSKDSVALGVGTRTAGTMDGTHSRAAGKYGFDQPAFGGLWAYDRLFQIGWTPPMRALGVRGGHTGYTTSRFVETILAPLVLEHHWSQDDLRGLIDSAIAERTADEGSDDEEDGSSVTEIEFGVGSDEPADADDGS
jgi:pimeloyl-ACP methyl ester carboxylesterase